MSFYTTELRYICEHYSGLSVDGNKINDIIDKAIPSIFDFDFPIFDEKYRPVLERKILKHYFTREIGLETVGLWKLKLDTKLNEIMPYYNQLYNSELIEFNPLYDVELKRERNTDRNLNEDTTNTEDRSGGSTTSTTQDYSDETENTESTTDERNRTTNGKENQTNTGNKTNMYSDTPQGAITDLQSGKYLTNATIDTENDVVERTTENTEEENLNGSRDGRTESTGNTTSDSNTDFSNTVDGRKQSNINTIEDYIENVSGSTGGKNFSERLQDFRNTFLNIDMMVINDLSELFFSLWQ